MKRAEETSGAGPTYLSLSARHSARSSANSKTPPGDARISTRHHASLSSQEVALMNAREFRPVVLFMLPSLLFNLGSLVRAKLSAWAISMSGKVSLTRRV